MVANRVEDREEEEERRQTEDLPGAAFLTAALRYSLTPQTLEDQTTGTQRYRRPSNFRGEGKALRRKHYASTGREPESG